MEQAAPTRPSPRCAEVETANALARLLCVGRSHMAAFSVSAAAAVRQFDTTAAGTERFIHIGPPGPVVQLGTRRLVTPAAEHKGGRLSPNRV